MREAPRGAGLARTGHADEDDVHALGPYGLHDIRDTGVVEVAALEELACVVRLRDEHGKAVLAGDAQALGCHDEAGARRVVYDVDHSFYLRKRG